jgi:tetratricopeptide (TPR) repeat protein
VAGLERAVQADARHGYARYVLAAALLRQDGGADRALQQLGTAVQHDDLLVDLALDLLGEHRDQLSGHAPALVLEGTLRLRKGERQFGVVLLERALGLQPELAPQIAPRLESEWDRDGSSLEIGVAFAHALRCAGQARRATRLYADLARRFPDGGARIVADLEALLETEPLAETHRTLWEIRVQRGETEAALQHLELALESPELDDEARRELLEVGLRQLPGAPGIICRLAELESRAGNLPRVEELLRTLLQQDPTRWESVLQSLRAVAPGVDSEELQRLEIDCLLAGQRGSEVLEALRGFRIAWPAQREAILSRYRLLVEQGSAGCQADLEFGLLLKEYGQPDAAVQVLEAGVVRLDQAPPAERDEGAGAQDRELRLALASLYVELGREREGRELLASVLDRPGDHGEAYSFLERLARHGLLSKLKNLRETIAGSPANLRAGLELARLSLLSCDFDGAREALHFTGDSPPVEAARRFLLARTYAEQDQPQVSVSVLRSLELDDVADPELRRNITYLRAVCHERLSEYGEAHALFLQLLSEFPYFKDTRERARVTYQKHLETALETRAEVLEKRTQLDVT